MCADLWAADRDPLVRGSYSPVRRQNPAGDGREAGHLEPGPRPLGLHPAAPHRPTQDLPHRQVPGGPQDK